MRVISLIAALILVSCSGGEREVVTLSVASSLTDAFELIEPHLESRDVAVDINTAGSATLVHQVKEGAPVGVIVTADRAAMDALGDRVLDSTRIATNRLTVLRSSAGPTIEEGSDLLDDDLIVAACDPSVPCGRLTEAVLAELNLQVNVDTFETSVRIVRERVVSGEADVGFVYVTDVRSVPGDRLFAEATVIDDVGLRNEVVVGLLDDGDAARIVYDNIVGKGPIVLKLHGFEEA